MPKLLRRPKASRQSRPFPGEKQSRSPQRPLPDLVHCLPRGLHSRPDPQPPRHSHSLLASHSLSLSSSPQILISHVLSTLYRANLLLLDSLDSNSLKQANSSLSRVSHSFSQVSQSQASSPLALLNLSHNLASHSYRLGNHLDNQYSHSLKLVNLSHALGSCSDNPASLSHNLGNQSSSQGNRFFPHVQTRIKPSLENNPSSLISLQSMASNQTSRPFSHQIPSSHGFPNSLWQIRQHCLPLNPHLNQHNPPPDHLSVQKDPAHHLSQLRPQKILHHSVKPHQNLSWGRLPDPS